jgi:hypothetical protein
MTNYVDLAFAAAERAGTLPRGFLRVRDAQRVLADYQRVMRADFWIRHRARSPARRKIFPPIG